jgi:hypothetical protein
METLAKFKTFAEANEFFWDVKELGYKVGEKPENYGDKNIEYIIQHTHDLYLYCMYQLTNFKISTGVISVGDLEGIAALIWKDVRTNLKIVLWREVE